MRVEESTQKKIFSLFAHIAFILSIIDWFFSSQTWLSSNQYLTIIDIIFYSSTLIWNLLFPYVFINFYLIQPEQTTSNDNNTNKHTTINYVFIFNFIFSIFNFALSRLTDWTEFNQLSYSIFFLLSVGITYFIAILYISLIFKENKEKFKFYFIILLIILTFTIVLYFILPFSDISITQLSIKLAAYLFIILLIIYSYVSNVFKKRKN